MSIQLHIFFIIFLVTISSCQVGPSYHPPKSPAPDEWKHSQKESITVPDVDNWWEIFNDDLLNDLEKQALENNYDLYSSMQRVIQARALAGVAASDLYPQISLDPSWNDVGLLSRLFGPATALPGLKSPFIREHQRTNSLLLNLNWELDLWGRLKSQYQSAVYSAQAQEDAFQSLLLLLTSDLANSYFQIRTLDAQIELYASTIKAYKKNLELNQARYDGKIVNYTDVSFAALQLTNAEADYYEALRLRDLQENLIAVLIGVPASDFCLEAAPLKEPPPQVPAGLPSDILLQRPDIAEAERQRASEQALIRSAYAAFFPSFAITASYGFSSPDLKHFLDWKSRYWMLGANIDQTVFDAGRKYYHLKYSIARFNEADGAYQQQVLTAFREVEDSLGDLEYLSKEADKISQSVVSASTTYRINRDRYYNGVTFYIDVVISETQLLESQRALNILLGQRYSATIQLIKALGGSWGNCE